MARAYPVRPGRHPARGAHPGGDPRVARRPARTGCAVPPGADIRAMASPPLLAVSA